MKHKIRDSIIRFIALLGITKIYQKKCKTRGPLVRVMAFHDVSDREWFEKIIAFLDTTYNIITPDEFHNKAFKDDEINILITFDDGYQSWIDIVAPVLKKHHIKGLFFVVSGLLDAAGDATAVEYIMEERLLISTKDPLTWDGARTLFAEGHTIGGHTKSHPNLATLKEEEMIAEICDDKDTIEREIETTLTDFAYPFGRTEHFNDLVRYAVSGANYHHVYTALPGFITHVEGIDHPRVLIEKNQPISSLKRWIEGAYDIFDCVT